MRMCMCTDWPGQWTAAFGFQLRVYRGLGVGWGGGVAVHGQDTLALLRASGVTKSGFFSSRSASIRLGNVAQWILAGLFKHPLLPPARHFSYPIYSKRKKPTMSSGMLLSFHRRGSQSFFFFF